DLEDRRRRRLRWRNASSMDQSSYLAQTRAGLDECMNGRARGRVDRRNAHLVAGVRQDLRRRLGVVLTQIRQQHMLADADPPRDGLTDLARTDDHDDVAHAGAGPFMSAARASASLSAPPA